MSKAEIEFAAENAQKMDDLISRSALLELYANTPELDLENYHVPVPVVRQNIIDMPTVDAVIPVFCKDCQSSKWDGYAYRCINPHGLRGDVKETDYCPRGIARCSRG